jgi:uncharacterized protein HemX
MSPRVKPKSKSKNPRSASTARGEAKIKEGRLSAAPLVIAALLIGAIAVAMGYTIHKQSQATRQENPVPQATPESGPPSGTDPGATQSNPANPNPNQSNPPSNQILTN